MTAQLLLLASVSAMLVGELPATDARVPSVLMAQAIQWQMFSSTEGGFAILMPARPQEASELMETPLGTLNVYVFSAETQDAGYLVIYADYPQSILQRRDSETVLQSWQEEFLTATGSRVVQERRIRVNGFPGREIEYENEDGLRGAARFFMVRERAYQAIAATTNGQSPTFARDADRFLESFRLIGGR